MDSDLISSPTSDYGPGMPSLRCGVNTTYAVSTPGGGAGYSSGFNQPQQKVVDRYERKLAKRDKKLRQYHNEIR